MSSTLTRIVTASCLATLLAGTAVPAESLSDGFLNPPDSARPRVWWHWVNGNISESGIDADLAWLKSVGIGGVQNFDVNLGMPTIVPKRIAYMTPEWKHAFAHAVDVAAASGLEFAIASSPGWSETGAPWVTPADAMKKLAWSETTVVGGRHFRGRLSAPPAATGPFQDLPYHDPLAPPGEAQHGAAPYYQEIGVIAIPMTAKSIDELPSARSGRDEPLDATALLDELLGTEVVVPRHAGEMPAVLLTYPKPVAVRTARLFVVGATSPFGPPAWRSVLEARGEGGWWRVADLPVDGVPSTVSFAPLQAREFRVRFESPPAVPGLIGAGAPGAIAVDIFPKPAADAPLRLAMLQLSAEPRVSHFEQKAGFAVALDYDALASQGGAEDVGVAPSQVIDLTSRMKPDGALDWTPPPGRWRILRMGWSLTGTTNHPANPEATGLEVDKYDGAAVRRYLETYLRGYQDAVGKQRIGARGISALLTDSTEVGASNWTARLPEQFRALRGYDLKPWLPALAGFIVESRARTDAFLYDYRRTLAELHAREHYGTVAAVAHEHGLTVYGEALEDRRPTLGDDLAMRAFADVPMAALWTYPRGQAPRSTLLGDMKGASSVAHVRGRSVVAAESMTAAFAPWAFAPYDLRRIVDLEFTQGINRPVIHTSVHQPDDKAPGLTLAIFGQYFNRHESWAGMARPWIDYIARSSYLLQQGHDVADVAWFIGEERPLTALFAEGPPAGLPKRHAWDAIDADVLMHELRVEQGALVTSGGARYAALYLGGSSQAMTLPTLRRLRELVDAGATVIGEAPVAGRGITDDAQSFAALVTSLWKAPATSGSGGRVISSRDVDAALDSMGLKPDVELLWEGAPAEVLSVHRRLPDADVYFVDNREARTLKLKALFRTAGREPQRWRAESGVAEPLTWRSELGRTQVQLELGPEESTFVVFSKPTQASAGTAPTVHLGTLASIEGPWDVSFQPGRGAPASSRFTQLASLSENSETAIRYFSGVATYRTSFTLKRGVARGAPLLLDLGKIGDVAEVTVNGKPVGTSWWPPYRVDIGAAVRRGRNTLEVRVANLWVNRLIGDAQPGATPVAFATGPTYFPNAPLRPSGLIGPVKLLTP